MGRLYFDKVEEELTNNLRESINLFCETEPRIFLSLIDDLTSIPELKNEKVAYIFGHGGQTIKTYAKIDNIKGVEVIWRTTGGPLLLKPIIYMIAGQFALIRFSELKKVREVFKSLSDRSVAGFYIFNKEVVKSLITHVKEKKDKSDIPYIISQDRGFLSFEIDGGNECSTGFYAIIKYGKECPKSITEIVNRIKLPSFYFKDKE